MNVEVRRVTGDVVRGMVEPTLSGPHKCVLNEWLNVTAYLWTGMVDGKLVCTWGLVPPTILSDVAHLWLYTTKALDDHQFLFIRHSQRAIESMLAEHPTIVGVTDPSNDRTLRWLKWLGATIEGSNGKMVNFVIRKQRG